MWAKLDDQLHENPKIGALSDKAFRLYILSITYSQNRRTKGRLTPLEANTVRKLAEADHEIIEELVRMRAWDMADTDYQIHDFDHYNPNREEISRKRSEAGTIGAQKRWQNGKSIANSMANEWQPPARGGLPSPESHKDSKVKDSPAAVAARGRFAEEFWKAFPARCGKKVGKADVVTWFKTHKPEEEACIAIMRALIIQKQDRQWTKEEGKYVPDAIKWLRRQGWADEIESGSVELSTDFAPYENGDVDDQGNKRYPIAVLKQMQAEGRL